MNRIVEGILRGVIPWWIIFGTDFNDRSYLYERKVKAWIETSLSFSDNFAGLVTNLLFAAFGIIVIYNFFIVTCKFFIGLKHGDERLPY